MIDLGVKGFTEEFAHRNVPKLKLHVGVTDVVLAATTVGGPVKGTAWHKSQRRAGIAATVFSALARRGPRGLLCTSSLYDDLESSEKGGVSFRLGMAFASIATGAILGTSVLEHLNATNTVLVKGSRRRADLFGLDGHGGCHVVEAKARSHGYADDLIASAKEQARNIEVIETAGTRLRPATRSACLADLSTRPVSAQLIDPPADSDASAVYEIDVERMLALHYSVVPDLLELYGEGQPPPGDTERDVVGAYLPGTEIWVGVDAALLRPGGSWRKRLMERADWRSGKDAGDETESAGRDGHVLKLGGTLAQIYESWREQEPLAGDPEEGRGERPS
ncbi:MAG: hypothetical protein QOE56_1878 [Solirubrobacterales bacterium]|nr:hypothetical protein [Solirubrobacterales bacterium]